MNKKSVTPSPIFGISATILVAAAAWKALDTHKFLNRGRRSVAEVSNVQNPELDSKHRPLGNMSCANRHPGRTKESEASKIPGDSKSTEEGCQAIEGN